MAPHRKAKQVRSNKQALGEIANDLKTLLEPLQKNNKLMIEEERKREEYFPYRFQPGHQVNSSTSSTPDPNQPVQDDIRRDSCFYPY